MKNKRIKKKYARVWQLYVLLILPIAYLLIFHYYPMLGAQMALRDFNPVQGIWGSPWVGFKHFTRFFNSYHFKQVLTNTLGISFYSLIAGFPIPILFAIGVHYITNNKYKKFTQMISYAPHFISTVVIVGMINQILGTRHGIINNFIQMLGGQPIEFLANSSIFSSIYVWSGIWQHTGYESIIYIAVLASINQDMHESAVVDGANKLQRIWYIDIPGLMPTAIILLILRMGRILSVGFEKVLLMQNSMNMGKSEIIDTLVYKTGIASALPNFSYATAIGLFKATIGLVLIVLVNSISKRMNETSLW